MSEQANGTSPTGIGCHRLPQIPTMSRNVKIAQSKNSVKTDLAKVDASGEAAVILIEGTDKIIKINSEGVTETIESTRVEATKVDCQKANGKEARPKRPRKGQTPSKAEPSGPDIKVDGSLLPTADSIKGRRNVSKGNSAQNKAVKELRAAKVGSVNKGTKSNPPDFQLKMNASKSNAVTVDSAKTVEDVDIGKIVNENRAPPSQIEEVPQKCVTKAAVSVKDSVKRNEKKQLEEAAKESTAELVIERLEQPEIPKMYFSAAGRILPRTVLLRESEKPSDAQLARIMEGKTNQFDEMLPIKWRIGDVVWGHVSGHPWWPGMVSSDPFSGLFTTINSGARMSRLYFVQYFGDEAERGWVRETACMTFEGRKKFLAMGDAHIKVTKDKGKKGKLIQAFCPNQRRKAAWDLAVDEAEDALGLGKEERIDKYTFVYEFLPNKKPSKGSGSTPPYAASTSPPNSAERRGVKRKEATKSPAGDDDDETDEYDIPASKRPRREAVTPATGGRGRSREEGSFETYCIKHREAVREEHPDYSGGMVIEALKQQWALMTPQQRLRYKSKFCLAVEPVSIEEPMDQETSQGSGKRLPRRSRPTLKKMEAEGEGMPDARRSRRTLDGSELASDSIEKTDVPDTSMPPGKGRKRRPRATAAEDEQTSSEASISFKSRASNDSDSNSDGQDENRCKGRARISDDNYVLEVFRLNNTAPTKKENLCAVCEKNGEVIECQGVCQGYAHPACVGLEPTATDFKCQECTSGEHQCFSCKKADTETKRCSVVQCGKFYHEDCMKKLTNARLEGKSFICPLHICATCTAESARNPKAVKGRLYRCVRCPTAYHVGDFCIAAGSVHLGGYYILCSSHFQPVKSHKHHQRINVSWCFSCSKGGSLVCCETCPAAFHTECAGLTSMPEDAWYCSDCSSGKKPLYGEIIWIKIGNYRWWPAEICHPRNVPTNIQEMAHSVGEFPARFFGSHDYYWTHQGRVFLFQEGDRGSKDTSASRGLFKVYYKGVKEATEAFKLWKAAKENKEQIEQERNDRKPAPFKYIKTCVPVGNVQLCKADLSEIPRCECKPDQENPCGSDTDCLNRMLMYECNPNVCPAKEACRNQRFQKREYPESAPYRTESRGWGLKTLVDIKKGAFVNEYVGDLIDEEECKRRIKQAHEDNVTNFYMLTVDKNRIIDAGPKGNNSRFMNHSCEPNLETQKWTVNGDVRVGLFAIKDIPAGSELTFNYNLECLGNEKTRCVCGSEICSGFLGVRPKTQAAAAVEKKKKEKEKDGKKKKKRKTNEAKKEHEDECFRCGEGGELVLCDKPNCPKVYHLQCLNLSKPPPGKWLCPWHHCDVCGKLAVKLCTECPNSFCQQHEEGVITLIKDKLVCAEHTDLIEGLATSASSDSASGQTSSSSSSMDSDDSADCKSSAAAAAVKVKLEPEERKEEEAGAEEESLGQAGDGAEARRGGGGGTEEPCKVQTDSKSLEASWEMARGQAIDAASSSKEKAAGRKRAPGTTPGKKGGMCRTKARYKAQLKVVDGCVSNTSSPLPEAASPPGMHADSDNDSNGLVIDVPNI